MSILKKYIQPRERLILNDGEIIIYNPNKDEKAKIKTMLEESAKLQTNDEGQLVVQTDFNEIRMFKFLVETLTNLSEDLKSLTDDEIIQLLENGNSSMKEVLREFKSIIKETSEEFIESMTDQIDGIYQLVKQKEIYSKIDEIAKGMNMTGEDLLLLSQKQNELNELQKKELPTPQDHLPKKQSKKRGRPKKADKVVKDTEEVKIEDSQNANS